MIDAPDATYLRIARSEQKNYTLLLFAVTGPLLAAAILVAAQAGNSATPFSLMLLVCVAAGPAAGLVFFSLGAFLLQSLLSLSYGLNLRVRDVAANLAFGSSPLMWMAVVVLPLQMGIFGPLLFSTNPPPWQLQPTPYWMLAGLDVLALLWSIVLLPRAYRVHGITYARAFFVHIAFWSWLAAAVFATSLLIS